MGDHPSAGPAAGSTSQEGNANAGAQGAPASGTPDSGLPRDIAGLPADQTLLSAEDWAAIPEEARSVLAPHLTRIQQGLAKKFQDNSAMAKKAGWWDYASEVPGVLDLVQRAVNGKVQASDGGGRSGAGEGSGASEGDVDLMDPKALGAFVAKTVEQVLASKLRPFEKNLAGLQQSIGVDRLERQFEALIARHPDAKAMREAILSKIANEEAGNLEDAYRILTYDTAVTGAKDKAKQELRAEIEKELSSNFTPAGNTPPGRLQRKTFSTTRSNMAAAAKELGMKLEE